MNAGIPPLMTVFRRQMLLTRLVRIGLFIGAIGAMIWATQLPSPGNKQAVFFVAMATLVGWVAIVVRTMRLARQLHAAGVLLSIGRLDDAEVWLRRMIARFSLSARSKLMACQQVAALLFRRECYRDVVLVCRELLRQRLTRFRQIWVTARLMLADSHLMLGEVSEAYEAIRPVYESELSLSERLKLLPIQLRYELAADHAVSAVQAMDEKVRFAELLESPQAALVHALLAEACRRQSMPSERAFLAERARLYHDLEELAERYPVIRPIAAGE